MIKRPKIAIIGAGGNVGAAVAQWAVQKELGDLVLIDIKAGPAEGRALDLTQCSPWEGFNNTSFVATDKSEMMQDADVVVMTAGVPRKRVIGSAGVLDSARFRTYLALAAKVSVEDVQAIVLGAHTDKDMVPILSTAMIGNVPASKFLSA